MSENQKDEIVSPALYIVHWPERSDGLSTRVSGGAKTLQRKNQRNTRPLDPLVRHSFSGVGSPINNVRSVSPGT